jgi:hypothetical protein
MKYTAGIDHESRIFGLLEIYLPSYLSSKLPRN